MLGGFSIILESNDRRFLHSLAIFGKCFHKRLEIRNRISIGV